MGEYNIIQAPEMLRRLAARLGLRQGHINPTLNEGVQSVIIVDDLSEQLDPYSRQGASYGGARQGVVLSSSDLGAATFETMFEISAVTPTGGKAGESRYKVNAISVCTKDNIPAGGYPIMIGIRQAATITGGILNGRILDQTDDQIPDLGIQILANHTFALGTTGANAGTIYQDILLNARPSLWIDFPGGFYLDDLQHQGGGSINVRRLIVQSLNPGGAPVQLWVNVFLEKQSR